MRRSSQPGASTSSCVSIRFPIVLSLAAILAGLSACTSATAPADELAAARRQWTENGPQSYSYTLARSCECLPEQTGPVVITVQDGAVVSRVYASTGTPVATAYQSLFPSIEGVFDLVDEAIRQGAEQLDVDYHRTLGYPVNIAINLHLRPVDGGLVVTTSDFHSL